MNVCPGGLITLHELWRYFCNGTGGNDNRGGVVGLQEYVTAISICICSRCYYACFSLDGAKCQISQSIWSLITQAVYRMSVAALFPMPNPLTAVERTNRIFVRLDIDNNFYLAISLEEFIVGALDDEWIKEMLECDPDTECGKDGV
uniref:Si:ch211-245j22.3 n=1 Tax=Salmo trutta TaxID=8032 RepID=A0A673WWX3_SALTR